MCPLTTSCWLPLTISRGRTSSSSCLNSVSGSTTHPSISNTRSSDSRSESRGRPSTRNSSFSDRERSNSRPSRSNGSPIGSIPPCGFTIGIGGQSAGRESRSVYNQPGRERGRDRTGRRINGRSSSSTLSLPDISSPTERCRLRLGLCGFGFLSARLDATVDRLLHRLELVHHWS